MRARIKEGWYPYGVGFIVEVEKYCSTTELTTNNPVDVYEITEIVSGTRKNYDLCVKKLLGTIVSEKHLDFNYKTDMQDTVKTFRVKIKENHPNTSMRGLIVNVSLEDRLSWGDRYKIEEVENCSKTHYNNYYIMEEFLDFEFENKEEIICEQPDKIDLFVTNEYNSKSRIFESGAKRAGDENKPYTHSIQPYTRLRFGYHMRMGARSYGDKNYLKGFPDESIIESGDRHWTNIMAGDMSEDNLSAMIFAIQLLMLNQEKRGIKPDNWFKKVE